MSNFYKTAKWKRKREKILRRDEYLCRECVRYGKTTEATTVHHINQLEHHPEFALANYNLVSMCAKCHDAMHDRNTRELTVLGLTWVERVSPHLQHFKK